jgi:hypothetical protein
MPYPAHMAKTSAVLNQMHSVSASISAAQNWLAISATIPSSSYADSSAYRSDWTNKRSNKGFYTFTTDRTPGGYIG